MLAAGGSFRLGYPKQLIEFDGTPLVRRAAHAALSAGLDPVVVVTGAESEKVLAALKDLNGITKCVNSEWQTGLASSLSLGLKTLRNQQEVDAVLISVADQPKITAQDLRLLMNTFASGHRLVAASYAGVLGVPAVFGREHFADLERLTGDKGAGSWLRAREKQVQSIPLESAAFDMDTEADLHRLTRESGRDD